MIGHEQCHRALDEAKREAKYLRRCIDCGHEGPCAGPMAGDAECEKHTLARAIRERDEARAEVERPREAPAVSLRGELCPACGRATYVGVFEEPCAADSDIACALRQRDELRAIFDGCLVHGCHTEESRALGDVLGLREGKQTAASTCAMAKEEIERLRRERDEANDAWAAVMAMSAMATTESGFPTITVGRHSLYALHRMCDRAEAERNAAQAELADVRAELAKVKGART